MLLSGTNDRRKIPLFADDTGSRSIKSTSGGALETETTAALAAYRRGERFENCAINADFLHRFAPNRVDVVASDSAS